MSSRSRAVSIVTLLVALAASPSIAAADVRSTATQVQPRPVVAVPDTRIERRTVASRSAWNRAKDTYARGYAYPSGWRVRLDACGSFVGLDPDSDEGVPLRVSDWTWRAIPLDGQADVITLQTPSPSSASCTTVVMLPALGRWQLELTVRDADGDEDTESQTRDFRDLLVMAIGDSFASGEGNPDPIPIPPGRPDPPDQPAKSAPQVTDHWTDKQCHRSSHAWPFRVAQALESRSTTVTFLSFACSGAEIRQLYDQRYGGQSPTSADEPLRPQIQVARLLLGDPLIADTRGVDLLFAAVGVNDMDFAGILVNCLRPLFDCRESLSPRLSRLHRRYDGLEVAISGNLRVRRTYLAEYPNRIFTNESEQHGGCGIFFPTMSGPEAAWISEQGEALNERLRLAATRWDWTTVVTRDAFRRYGYCARSETMFRTISRSALQQGDHKGTAHPNHRGHGAVTKLMRQVVDPAAIPLPISRQVVRFQRVRVTDLGFDGDFGRIAPARPFDGRVRVGVDWMRSGCGRATEVMADVPVGQWVDVRSNPCMSYPAPTNGNAIAVRASAKLGNFNYDEVQFGPDERPPKRDRSYGVERIHRRAASFDARPVPDPNPGGTRMLSTTHDFGSLTVEYRVERETVTVPVTRR